MSLNRRKERELVFQMLFAAQFSPQEDVIALYENLIEECETEGAGESEYIKDVFCGAWEGREAVREKIESAAQGWRVERFSKATLAILYLAVFEMEKREDVPVKIAINEAVELAKRFAEDGSRKFINGILGTLAGK